MVNVDTNSVFEGATTDAPPQGSRYGCRYVDSTLVSLVAQDDPKHLSKVPPVKETGVKMLFLLRASVLTQSFRSPKNVRNFATAGRFKLCFACFFYAQNTRKKFWMLLDTIRSMLSPCSLNDSSVAVSRSSESHPKGQKNDLKISELCRQLMDKNLQYIFGKILSVLIRVSVLLCVEFIAGFRAIVQT